MKTVLKDEQHSSLSFNNLKASATKTHLRSIEAHYSCSECYAAWYGQPVCIACGKQTFVVTSNLYSEQHIFDIF